MRAKSLKILSCRSNFVYYLAILGLLLFGIEVSAQQLLYVATTGSDANSGTESAPLASISRALSRAASGDTVIVLPGHYNGGISFSRTFNSPVTIKALTPYTVSLSNDYLDTDGNPRINTILTISSIGSANLIIEGFVFSNEIPGYVCEARGAGFLVHIQDASNVTLKNNVLHGNTGLGGCNELLKVNRSGEYYPRNILIAENVFYDPSQLSGNDLVDAVRPGELDIVGNIFFSRPRELAISYNQSQSFITLKREVTNPQSLGYVPRNPRYQISRNVFLNWFGKSDQAFLQLGEDGYPQHEISEAVVENNLFIGNSSNRLSPLQCKGCANITYRANTFSGNFLNSNQFLRAGGEGQNLAVQNISLFNNIFSDSTGTILPTLINAYGAIVPQSFAVDRNLFWNGGNAIPSGGSTPRYLSDENRVEENPLLETNHTNIILPVFDAQVGRFESGAQTIQAEFARLVEAYAKIPANSGARDRADSGNMPSTDILSRARDLNPDIGCYELLNGNSTPQPSPTSSRTPTIIPTSIAPSATRTPVVTPIPTPTIGVRTPSATPSPTQSPTYTQPGISTPLPSPTACVADIRKLSELSNLRSSIKSSLIQIKQARLLRALRELKKAGNNYHYAYLALEQSNLSQCATVFCDANLLSTDLAALKKINTAIRKTVRSKAADLEVRTNNQLRTFALKFSEFANSAKLNCR